MRDAINQLVTLSSPALKKEKEVQLFTELRQAMNDKSQERFLELQEQIVLANIPLVASMVRRVRTTQLDPEERMSIGLLTLMNCVTRFDPTRGFKFSTYLCQALFRDFVSTNRRNQRHAASTEEVVDQTYTVDLTDEDMLKDTMSFVLDNEEIQVLELRFGLGDRQPLTQRQVSSQLKISTKKVKLIQEAALEKLKVALEGTER